MSTIPYHLTPWAIVLALFIGAPSISTWLVGAA